MEGYSNQGEGIPMKSLAWIVLPFVLLLQGCYIEMWGGAYPITRGTSTVPGEAPVKDGPLSYSIGVAVGFWFDHYGLGVGYAPNDLAPEAVMTDQDGTREQTTVRADQLRLDLDLPLKWWNPWFFPRATLAYAGVRTVDRCLGGDCQNRTDHPAKGKAVYLGLTSTFFSRNLSISAGPSYWSYGFDAVSDPAGVMPEREFRAFGAQLRLMVVFRMGLEFFQFYTPSLIRPIPAGLSHKCRPFATEKDCYP